MRSFTEASVCGFCVGSYSVSYRYVANMSICVYQYLWFYNRDDLLVTVGLIRNDMQALEAFELSTRFHHFVEHTHFGFVVSFQCTSP